MCGCRSRPLVRRAVPCALKAPARPRHGPAKRAQGVPNVPGAFPCTVRALAARGPRLLTNNEASFVIAELFVSPSSLFLASFFRDGLTVTGGVYWRGNGGNQMCASRSEGKERGVTYPKGAVPGREGARPLPDLTEVAPAGSRLGWAGDGWGWWPCTCS